MGKGMATAQVLRTKGAETASMRLTSAVRKTFEGISTSFEDKFKVLHSNGYGEDRIKELDLFQAGSTLYQIMRANCGMSINDVTIGDPSARMLVTLGMKGNMIEWIESYLKDLEANAKRGTGEHYERTLSRFEFEVRQRLGRMMAVTSVIDGSRDHKQIMEGVCALSDEVDAFGIWIKFFRHETIKPGNREADSKEGRLVMLMRPPPNASPLDSAA